MSMPPLDKILSDFELQEWLNYSSAGQEPCRQVDASVSSHLYRERSRCFLMRVGPETTGRSAIGIKTTKPAKKQALSTSFRKVL